jgi:mRNA-degrading endonuclease RelE of RelBE toxin-antitoxin system
MKTTVDISDSLLKDVKRLAARDHTTVRALIEEGLRRITSERKKARSFKLRKLSFRGNGLQAPLAGVSWQQIRDASYEGRGA